MTGDKRWQRQWDIFHDALEQPAGKRARFVQEACGNDQALADAVQSLLDAHTETGEFLEKPLLVTKGVLDELEPEAMIGSMVGPYAIRAVIGEGGMGVVYEAEQSEPVKRQVALKIIKLGMNTREVVARFELERQALAVMNHPNVAKVHDAGATADGRPYFVMEYVQGAPITEYCDQRRFSNRERLEVCRDVFGGIQHAHQKGLIHRDIKPSNVLIEHQDGERPVAKIIDFGIAKATSQHATEKTIFTQLGRMVGTPAYMSPEQAALDGSAVDTRSDIYSLCVLLYELLTGALPFENQTLLSAGYAEMQRIIREDDPPAPSTRISAYDADTVSRIASLRHSSFGTLKRELAGDLDWIILKGLEKDPTRRYDSVTALAEDIERHLSDEPVLARPPGAVYKAGKFVRRHTIGVTVAALTVLLTGSFVISTIIQSRELARALTVAEQEQAKAEQVSDFIVNLLTQSDPNVSQGESITVRDALDRGAENIGAELADQPELRFILLTQMAGIYRQLGFHDRARDLLEEAEALREQIESINPEAVGYFFLTLGHEHHDQGEYEPALGAYTSSIDIFQRLGEDSQNYILALDDLGELHTDMGNYDDATTYLQDALAMARRVNSGDFEPTAAALQGLGYAYLQTGNNAAAGPLFDEAVGMNRRLHGDDSIQLATSLTYQAIHYRRIGNYDSALTALEEALRSYRTVLGEEHAYVATTLINLSTNAASAGRFEEAERYANESIAQYLSIFGDSHPNTATAYYSLGQIQTAKGDYANAENTFRTSLEIDVALLGSEHPSTLMALEQISVAVKRQGRLDEAETLQRQVLDGRIAALGSENPAVANAHVNLSSVLALTGDLDGAEQHARRAVEILETIEPRTPRMLGSKTQLAYVWYEKELYEESEALYAEILGVQREILDAGHPNIAQSLYGIGLNKLARGLPSETELTEALAIREAVLGRDHEQTRLTRDALKLAAEQ